MQITPAERRAVILALEAVGGAIRDLGSVPSGELYARVMGHMSYSSYQQILDLLKSTKQIEQKNNVLYWIGDKKGN